jgi:hypothetical protein
MSLIGSSAVNAARGRDKILQNKEITTISGAMRFMTTLSVGIVETA